MYFEVYILRVCSPSSAALLFLWKALCLATMFLFHSRLQYLGRTPAPFNHMPQSIMGECQYQVVVSIELESLRPVPLLKTVHDVECMRLPRKANAEKV